MTTDNLFSERQRFRQIWLWLLIAGVNGIFIYGMISQVYLGHTFGNRPMSNTGLVIATLTMLLIPTLFLLLRLDTAIKQDGIYYRFLPFQFAYKRISWDRISKCFVREYNPIIEYGGWGLRIGLFGKGQAFNVSGNKGLQLIYDNGKRFLLGTQKPEEIKNVLQQLGQLTSDT